MRALLQLGWQVFDCQHSFLGVLFEHEPHYCLSEVHVTQVRFGQVFLNDEHLIIIIIDNRAKMFGKISLGSGEQSRKNIFNHQSNAGGRQQQKKEEKNTKNPSGERATFEKKSVNPSKNKFIKKEEKRGKREDFKSKCEELQGAKFRILNELLYTNTSQSSKQFFGGNREDFQVYHEGYRHQTTKWKYRPVDQIIEYILKHKETYLHKKIIDLGCGEGFLQEELIKHDFTAKKIGSYDLVSLKPFIKEADIANLPLKDSTVDLCVFCLSLMGTNYLSFIRQARRVLRTEGELIISEVESRSPDWGKFVQMVEHLGFKMMNNGLQLLSSYSQKEGRFFRTMLFRKCGEESQVGLNYEGQSYDADGLSQLLLLSCKYKRR